MQSPYCRINYYESSNQLHGHFGRCASKLSRNILEVCIFVAKFKELSGDDANEMIAMIRRITHVNGKEIPIKKEVPYNI